MIRVDRYVPIHNFKKNNSNVMILFVIVLGYNII